jgi:hypothetical protein
MSLNIAAIFESEAATGTSDRSMVSVPLAAVETDAKIADRIERGGIDFHKVPCWSHSLDPFEQLGGLCSPPAKQFDPERPGRVLTVCDRCQSKKYVDVPIHDGTSSRRDCRQCFRFMGFPKWYDEDFLEEHCPRPLSMQSFTVTENEWIMTRKKRPEATSEKNELAFAIRLAKGSSIAEAAKEVRVAESTGYRWAKKPVVRQAVEDFRRSVLQTACNKMISITCKAVETLGQLLDSDNEQIRLSTARAVLDGSVKLRELSQLEAEIERIHEIMATTRVRNNRGGRNNAH